MVLQDSLLITLVKLVDRLPMPSSASKRGRGHPMVYPGSLVSQGVSHYDCSSLALGS